jgi:hypothetical protein
VLSVPAGRAAEAPVVHVAKPPFPPPQARVVPSGPLRLVAVSVAPRTPTYTQRPGVPVPPASPRSLGAAQPTRAFAQPGTTFVVYGETLVAALGPRDGLRYALDLRSFGFPPRSIAPSAYGPQ